MAEDPESHKATGNAFFAKGDNESAINEYTRAIKLDPKNPVYYSNRAAAYMKLKRWVEARDDCTKGLNLKYERKLGSKLYWRSGVCLKELGSYALAESSFKHGLEQDPENSVLQDELAKLVSSLRREPKPKTESETIDKSSSAWSDLKKSREKRTNIRKSSPSNPTPVKCTTIPIQIVDSLPEKFSQIPKEIATPVISSSLPSPSIPSKPVVPLSIPSPLTLYTLMQLMRSSKFELPQIYNHLFFNVPPSRYAVIHETGGIDYEVIEFVLDSIIHVATDANDNSWLTRAVDILDGMASCTRFGMSKIFVSSSKLDQVKDLLKSANIDSDELSRIVKVYK